MKNLRRRYGSAGNKDDRFDAYVLADVRAHRPAPAAPAGARHRSRPPRCARLCRARKDLVAHRVALANQLRAHLQIVFPAAVDLFADIDSAISLAFLDRFPTQDARRLALAQAPGRLAGRVGYSGRTDPAVLHARSPRTPRPTGDHGQRPRRHHPARSWPRPAQRSTPRSQALAEPHRRAARPSTPTRQIFTTLPRAGTVRAARLLAEIGDARGRFPTPDSLACLAGVAPSTRQSGKTNAVTFRWAADKQLRDAVCDFAGDSRHANPWAADLYNRARARGHDHPHAVRILARAWSTSSGAAGTTNTPYDPDRHRALQQLLNQDQQAAA